MSSMRVPPTFNSVRRSIVTSGLKLRTSSMLKRSPKNGLLKTPGAPALRASSSAYGRCVLRAQQADCAQIERLLAGCQAGIEFLQPRREKFHALALEVQVRIPRHEQKQQLWILRRRHAIDGFQILEVRMTRRGSRAAFALAGGKTAVRNDEGAPDEKRSEQAEKGF